MKVIDSELTLPLAVNHLASRDCTAIGPMGGGGSIGAGVTLGLNDLRDLQHVPQAFVLDDGALIDRAEFVVDGVGE